MNWKHIVIAFDLIFFFITPPTWGTNFHFISAEVIEYEWKGKMEISKYNSTEYVINFEVNGTLMDKDVMVYCSIYAKNGHSFQDIPLTTLNMSGCEILTRKDIMNYFASGQKCLLNVLPTECPPEGFDKAYLKGVNCQLEREPFLQFPLHVGKQKKFRLLLARRNGTKLIQFIVVNEPFRFKRRHG